MVRPVKRFALACVAAVLPLVVAPVAHGAEPGSVASAAFPVVSEEPAPPPAVARFDSEPTTTYPTRRVSASQPLQPTYHLGPTWPQATQGPRPAAPSPPVGQFGQTPAAAHDAFGPSDQTPAENYQTVNQSDSRPAAAHEARTEPAPSVGGDTESSRKRSDAWVVSVEGVTHAPVDVGVQAGIMVPMGLRLSGGYGWVPSQYLNFVTSAVAIAANTGSGSAALLKNGFQSGRTWRAQVGIRPFSKSGVYLDGGYSEVTLEGSFDTNAVTDFAAGTVHVETKLRMWLVELGYQTDIAGRVVVGIGAGVMGTLDAKTQVDTVDTPLGQDPIAEAAAQVDDQLERHGFVPTLTLRLGLDFI